MTSATMTRPSWPSVALRPLKMSGVQAMARSSAPSVVIAAMICVTVIIVAIIGGGLWLALSGNTEMAVITTLGAIITPWIVQIFGRMISFFGESAAEFDDRPRPGVDLEALRARRTPADLGDLERWNGT